MHNNILFSNIYLCKMLLILSRGHKEPFRTDFVLQFVQMVPEPSYK